MWWTVCDVMQPVWNLKWWCDVIWASHNKRCWMWNQIGTKWIEPDSHHQLFRKLIRCYSTISLLNRWFEPRCVAREMMREIRAFDVWNECEPTVWNLIWWPDWASIWVWMSRVTNHKVKLNWDEPSANWFECLSRKERTKEKKDRLSTHLPKQAWSRFVPYLRSVHLGWWCISAHLPNLRLV